MRRKIKCVTTLHAKEIIVDPALVAVIAAHNFHARVCSPCAQRRLAAIGAVSAGRTHMVHFPRPRFVSVCARGQRSHRTDVNARTALFTIQALAFIGRDHRTDAAILHPQRRYIHGHATHSHTAVAENAARPVEKHHRRPLLLFFVIFRLDEFRFVRTVGERHVLQFTFAARIAHRTIQRMVAQQKLDHGLPRLVDFLRVGRDHHAVRDHRRTRGLQLGHFLHFHQAHATRALQRKVRVIAERRHFNARGLARLNQKRSRRGGQALAINCECYVRHFVIS